MVISDFYEDPDQIVRTIEPLRFHGNEVILFHVLDPQEIRPELGDAALLVDLETDDRLEVTPEYARNEYREKMNAHIEALRDRARGAGMDYYLLVTSTASRRRSARIPHHPGGEVLDGFSGSLVSGGIGGWACPSISTCCAARRPRRSHSAR